MQDVQNGNDKKAILCISGGKFMEKLDYPINSRCYSELWCV